MPFRDAESSLRDIVDAVDMIGRFTAGMDLQTFREDPKTISAVERKLQIPDVRVPELDWRNIRGIGNWLRHQYERIDPETIWKTVTDDLPPLKAGALRALKPADNSMT